MTLVYLGCAWFAGLLLGQVLGARAGVLWAVGLAALAAALFYRVPRGRMALACLAVASLATSRFAGSLPRPDRSSLTAYNGRGIVTVEGVVADEPQQSSGWATLRVNVDRVEVDGNHEARGALVAKGPLYPEVRYGDRVRLRGKLQAPPVLADFSYRDYLARQGVFSHMPLASVSVLEHGRGNPIRAALIAVRARAAWAIARLLPEPEASLLTGILTGKDDGIPADVLDAFRAAGTAHIIAISGFNISIISGALIRLLRRHMRPTAAGVSALVAVAVYTLVVGAGASVLRAAIMGSLYIIATAFGRKGDALTLLVAAGWGITLWQPQALLDVGFQLSFAATLGMILLLPRLDGALRRLRGMGPASAGDWLDSAAQPVLVTLAALIMTLPISAYHFHRVSLATIPANLVVFPAQPAIMSLGGGGTLLGMIWPPLGQPLAWGAWLFLTFTIRASEWFARIPLSQVSVGTLPVAAVAGYYALIASLAARRGGLWAGVKRLGGASLRTLARGRVVWALLAAGALVWASALAMPDGRLHVTFLDVGEGDAVLIQTASGETVLVDGGSDPARLLAQVGCRLPFWHRRIDLAVLTHPHLDHLLGLVGLAEQYRVGTFLEGTPSESEEHRELLARMASAGARLAQAEHGQTVRLGAGAELRVLWPVPTLSKADYNEQSLVLLLSFGSARFLLTGDVGRTGQEVLLQQCEVPPCTVLKAPHHGGSQSVLPAFAAAAAAEVVVVTPGPVKELAEPSAQAEAVYADTGARVLHTGRDGSVEIATDGVRYWVRTSR